jgi:hypothetical protein
LWIFGHFCKSAELTHKTAGFLLKSAGFLPNSAGLSFKMAGFFGISAELLFVYKTSSQKFKAPFRSIHLMLVGPAQAASAFLMSSYRGLGLEVISQVTQKGKERLSG